MQTDLTHTECDMMSAIIFDLLLLFPATQVMGIYQAFLASPWQSSASKFVINLTVINQMVLNETYAKC